MENKLDDLFKNGLQQHSVLPSENAWARIETQLSKKNNFAMVWRIAAALLLMGSLYSAIYWQQESAITNSNSVTIVENKKTPSPSSSIKRKHIEEMQKTSTRAYEKLKPTQLHAVMQKTNEVISIENVQEEPTQEIVPHEEIVTQLAPSTVAQTEKPIVLEFTLEPVQTLATAEVQEKNSGLKKFFNKAKELKNGEGGINLADFANRLFASNSKKDQDTNALN